MFEQETTALRERAQAIKQELRDANQKLEDDKSKFKQMERTHLQNIRWEKEAIKREKDNLLKMETRARDIIDHQKVITVVVDGEKFYTLHATLAKCQDSIFPTLIESLDPKKESIIFIDRDSKHFKFILNYLRQGEEVMRSSALNKVDQYTLKDILFEVKYYKITNLERLLKRKLATFNQRMTFSTLLKNKYFKECDPSQQRSTTVGYKFVTAKEVVIDNADLTEITFDSVLFLHHVKFTNCIMASATFKNCNIASAFNFTNVDLYKARFDHCIGLDMSQRLFFDATNESEVTFIPPLNKSC